MTATAERLRELEPMVMRLATELRAKYRVDIELDELFAAGMEGLVAAERAFDPERGATLATFAYHRVRGAIIDNCRALGKMRRIYRERAAFDSAAADIVGSQPPPTGEVGRTARASWVANTLDAMAAAFTLSRESEPTFVDPKKPVDETVETAELVEMLHEALPALEPTSESVVRRHYLGGETFSQIASDLGLSRATISRVHRRALDELRPLVSGRARFDDDG